MPPSRKIKLLFTFVGVLYITAGVAILWVTWNVSVRAAVADAQKTASISALIFPADMLNKLEVSAADLEKSEYTQIKSNLASVKKSDSKIRFAYLYTQKEGKLYFVADSEPADSKDYSPPGQEYPEASEEYKEPYLTNDLVLTKPATDRWGTWVSMLVPIRSAESNKVVAVFAIDYPAENWNSLAKKNTAQTGMALVSLAVLIIAFYSTIKNDERIKENERNYKTFFETIDDIVLVGDNNEHIRYTNRAASQKLGYSKEELMQMRILDLNPTDQRNEAEAIYAEMFAGKRKSCTLPLMKKDGTVLPSETRVWFGKWDGLDCIFGISKDLGQEQALLQKLNKIFSDNPTLMAVSSLSDGLFTDVNGAFLTKLGYTKDEVIGKTSKELGLFVNPEKQEKISKDLLSFGFVRNVGLQVKTKSGAILEGLFSGEILENQGKKYFLTVMVDQTEIKQEKDAIVKSNEELSKMNRIMVDRELKMIELKKEIEKLKNKIPENDSATKVNLQI